jgi:hypothetical protein
MWEARMKRFLVFCFFITIGFSAFAQTKAVLFIYDEKNEQLDPYIGKIKDELNRNQILFDESAVRDIKNFDTQKYDTLMIYSAVMAFNMKSPIRDWLKTNPKIKNKRTVILVTANRWFLDTLFTQQMNLLKKNEAQIVDAISSATKELDDGQKQKLVKKFVEGVEK